MKLIQPASGDTIAYYYVKDGSGNLLSMYKRKTVGLDHEYRQQEVPIYGSSRIGLRTPDILVKTVRPTTGCLDCLGCDNCPKFYWTVDLQHVNGYYARELTKKAYELTDHLGNVRVVVSDRKNASDSSVVLLSYTNYYAFGGELLGKTYLSNEYRYGFNGQEKDDEVMGVSGSSYDFGARMYDPRLGRWLAIDPLAMKYPSLTPYNFCANNPIFYIDPDGKKIIVHYIDDNGHRQKIKIKTMSDIEKLKDRPGFVKDVYETLNYIKDSPDLQFAIETKAKVHVRETIGADALQFRSKELQLEQEGGSLNPQHTIFYEAHQAANIKDDEGKETGEYQSPALGFLHEIGHFVNRIKNGAKKHTKNSEIKENPDGSYVDPIYHSPEEKDVIQNTETPFAEKHGEPVRKNHKGSSGKYVDSPTEHSNSKKEKNN